MPRNSGIRTLCSLAALTLLSCLAARGQAPQHFAGFVNDFTPSNVSGGPYVMNGKWSLDIHHAPGHAEAADFSLFMNMETSDQGINEGIVDPTNTTTRNAHTHNITMTNVSVTYNSPACPANPSSVPAATGGNIMIMGNVDVTANGSPASFEAKGTSTLMVCLTGGSQVPLSNLTMTFVGPATGHFGSQQIRGVVRK
jgi:hypothetical protein